MALSAGCLSLKQGGTAETSVLEEVSAFLNMKGGQMNWTDPKDLSGLVMILVSAFIGFALPVLLRKGKEKATADRLTLICKIVSMVLALAGIILLILI